MRIANNRWQNLIALTAMLLALSGCGGGGGNAGDGPRSPVLPAEAAIVAGRVADAETGEPLAGVTVQIGSLKTTSDSQGKFSLADVAPTQNLAVKFSKPEYASNFATVNAVKGQTSVANRRLARVAVTTTLGADSGGTVTLNASPAMVQLPPGALVNSVTGEAASGIVSVEMTPIDPSISPLIMPGNYRAEGEAMPIESMGAIQVEIDDSSGARLNLAAGKTATVRIPVPLGVTSPPLTMPLYYFNESSGLWIREGSASLAGAAPHQYYEGRVAHFSTWNADMPSESIVIRGCVVNKAGQPLAATVTSSGIDFISTSSAQSVMPTGKFELLARRDSRIEVTAEAGEFLNSVEVTTGSTDLTLPACLVVEQNPPVIRSQPSNIMISPGSLGMLEVRACLDCQYQWYRNGQPIPARTRYLILNGDSSAEAEYYVVVSNAFGSVTSQHAQVVVGVPSVVPTIIAQPRASIVLVGGSASFTVQVEGDGLSYQWLRDGIAISGANGATLALTSVSPADSGAKFSCRVSNGAGAVLSDSALLTVSTQATPVAISQQPSNASVRVGQTATFAVVASGTAPLSYQWMRNGIAISNATSATYHTPPAVLTDDGAAYSVTITNAGGTVTSNPASLTVTLGTDTNGLYLSFMTGQSIGGSFDRGAVPANGGTAVSLLPAVQGTIVNEFFQVSATNGVFRNYQMQNFLFWQNQRLYRQDLLGPSGVPAPVQVSSLTSSELCMTTSKLGVDYADASKSWQVFRKPGPDGRCPTSDDLFVAARLNMTSAEPPLAVLPPVAAFHGTNGALNGWLLRQGQLIKRANADFSNPIPDFNLPAVDLQFAADGNDILPGILFFASGKMVYALDTNRPAPSTLVPVTGLDVSESLFTADAIDAQNVVIAVQSSDATRLVRYSIASMLSQDLGTVPTTAIQMFITPTRYVLLDGSGKLWTLPRNGGQAQAVYMPTGLETSLIDINGGERIWQQFHDSVVSVNSDGSGVLTLPGSQLAGCIYADAIVSTDMGCSAIVVLQGTSLLSYDAATGALRQTYGTIPMPVAPVVSTVNVASVSTWGQGAVVTQFNVNPSVDVPTTVISYYIKTDQAGITRLSLP